MLPNIKIFLPCLLLHAILVGRTNGFGHQPKGGWGPLWLNDTNPGEIDMLGDLPVHRSRNIERIHSSSTKIIHLTQYWSPGTAQPATPSGFCGVTTSLECSLVGTPSIVLRHWLISYSVKKEEEKNKPHVGSCFDWLRAQEGPWSTVPRWTRTLE